MPRLVPVEDRIRALELVIHEKKTIASTARRLKWAESAVAAWVKQHRTGERTLEALRATVIAPPTHSIEVVHEYVRDDIRYCTRTELLRATLAYVLHPDASLDDFAKWVRFYVAAFN